MDTRRWKIIKSTFEEVVAKPETERTLYLDQTCAGDSELRTEVESLLEYHKQAERFLEPAPQGQQPDTYIGKHFGP